MRDGFIKVAAATPTIRVADCAHNASQAIHCMEQAVSSGVHALVMPELCMTGYTCGDLFFQDALLDAAELALQHVLHASREKDMLVAIGLPLRYRRMLYNCAAVMHNGRLLGIVPKAYVSDFGECEERRYFAAPMPQDITHMDLCGQHVPFGCAQLFQCEQMQHLCVGIEIGRYDGMDAPVDDNPGMHDATIILQLSASSETAGQAARRRMHLKSKSERLFRAYIYASAGQGESTTDLVFAGHNLIVELGEVLAESLPFSKDALTITEVDCQRLDYERRRRNIMLAQRMCTVHPVSMRMRETILTRRVSPSPFLPEEPKEHAEFCESILEIQAHGLKQRLEHIGCEKAVLGISGGLDSTLALLVAVRAMQLLSRPPSDILAITMPCFGTTSRTKNNAEALCAALDVPCKLIDITAAVAQHLQDIEQTPGIYDAAFENAQARERMQVLMDMANRVNGIVIGTGDLSELALGWTTYNGDHMSMYAVNASVPKTLMRHMVAHIADATEQTALKTVLTDILDTPISPELLPAQDNAIAQPTEALVGPYVLHDFFLYHILRWGCTPRKVKRLANYAFDGQYSEEEIAHWLHIWLRRFFSQQFKRSCMPDGPTVGPVSLSPRTGFHMPSDAVHTAWEDWE